MAHLLRGKQAGVQNDLSAGLTPDAFNIDDINRFGINSQISQIAYDPVQSLIALGTNDTQFGRGQIYVFGQKRVNAVLSLAHKASVKTLQFCADKILCLDSKNDFTVFSLETKRIINSFSPPGTVTSLHSDPTLDYALLGMQNGEIMAYDLDREGLAPFKIPNFWKEQDPRARILPIVALSFHPRDIGTLLIGYHDGAVIYSFKQNKPMKFFHYQLPKGAPGGDSDPAVINMARSPSLTHAVWHPTGTFILTGHDDGSLVFWDPFDGRVVMARTLTDTNIDKPSRSIPMSPLSPISTHGSFTSREPLQKIVWCANQDPDDTAILISGGTSSAVPANGLTLFELGRTPNYSTSSWQILAQHFESPKRQRMLPTPPNAEVLDFCLIPRSSPHFHGAHDPVAVVAVLSSGELITLTFPSGLPISPTNQLSVSMTFVHPFINRITMAPVERTRWLGMTETRSHGPQILKGGTPAQYPLKRFEERNIVQTAHADGTIRLWDAGHGDEIENDAVLQADLSRAVGRHDNLEVTTLSLAGATGELAAGLRSGELVVFRWGHNKNTGREPPAPSENVPRGLTNLTDRRDPALAEGLFPFTLLDEQGGPVSAAKLSDVGFVAAGFESGSLAVIDLRGPAIIFHSSISESKKADKRGSLRRSSIQSPTKREWPTALEFSVMTTDEDSYSSILLHVGTSAGTLATFKLLPEQSGRYSVQFAGSISVDDSRVIKIVPIDAASGRTAYATQAAVAGLRNGARVNGVVLAVTETGARIFKPASHKGAHKSFDNFFCHSATVTRVDDVSVTGATGSALVGLFGDGSARAYSIPALREIANARIDKILDVRRLGDAVVTGTGDVIGWTGPSEVALCNVWGSGLNLNRSKDILFNPELVIPPRPTISNIQWISGTQYVTPSDMDMLIGGPDRPPSKRMIMQARTDEQAARKAGRSHTSSSSSAAPGKSQESYWEYMTRQINERTEKLGTMGDNVERLQDNAAGWSSDVSKYVAQQKRNMVMGAVKSKMGM
ncbi:hypothetical protein NA57DRAFT_78368 [Rhizodiscina lignyota]|uniref:Lethal giant larvae (Lgl)-like C-terminal domain-containing protein n=1 Tax=Rhizodiscina lignyota TaxID=1504668 RepID=A0A9P4M4G3_9PEZI|nr:hypothetical protein NA57DRAFT_78368 [Rhizodiscina lignyota]